MARNAAIDNIRILLTALVVFHHAAIAYGGSGGWYWREQADSSNVLLICFNAINQSYFMGFFFLLSGYFSAISLDRKGSTEFLLERMLRLGLPLLFYVFVLSPLTIAAASEPNLSEWPGRFAQMFSAREFGPGPLWFAQALLIFSAILLLFNHFGSNFSLLVTGMPKPSLLLVIALALGLLTFLLRLVIPVGVNVYWLQLGFFPAYVFLFFVGVASSKSKLLEVIQYRHCRPWIGLTLVCIASLPFALNGAFGAGNFHGGWNWNALYYAMWEPLTALGFILGLLWFFQRCLSEPNRASSFLARRAYAVFILHPPALVVSSIAISGLQWADVLKTALSGFLACLLCLVIATLALKLPGLRKVL